MSEVNLNSKITEKERALEQVKNDIGNQNQISVSQQRYMKCSRGKCPQMATELSKKWLKYLQQKRKKSFITSRVLDKRLESLFVRKGRDKRIRALKSDLKELNLRLKVASGKCHREETEKNFREIERHLRVQKEMEEEIRKAKMEISHIKSQFQRLDKKTTELSHETEADAEFIDHWKKANRQLEIYEGRVYVSRKREALLTIENQRLRELLNNMLYDRAIFNSFWKSVVKKLKDRKKFLLDMIERAGQAFSQDSDFMDVYKKLQAKRRQDREIATAEMMRMERQIDANQIMSRFLGSKGKRRFYAPMRDVELERRANFKRDYTDKYNLYKKIMEEAKLLTNRKTTDSMKKTMLNVSNERTQLLKILDYLGNKTKSVDIDTSQILDLIKLDLKNVMNRDESSKQTIDNLHTKISNEMNKTLQIKDDIQKQEVALRKHFNEFTEMAKMLNCDLTPISKALDFSQQINERNFKSYLPLIEQRINEILAFVYCHQRAGKNITIEGNNFVVHSMRRQDEAIVKIEEIVVTQQCPECAELENINRFDERTTYMTTEEELPDLLANKIDSTEMAFRMHTLSACNLPRSGIIASRRYAK